MSTMNFWELVVKSKLPPWSGSSPEEVWTPSMKRGHKVFFFFFPYKEIKTVLFINPYWQYTQNVPIETILKLTVPLNLTKQFKVLQESLYVA